jgi:GT2 family glycosyltransferase
VTLGTAPAVSLRANPPTVSIVVPTMGRPAALQDALASLMTQQTDDAFSYEIVVVDNAREPDAGTQRTVAALAADPRAAVRCVHECRAGVARARNRGVAAARGEWIAFFDDDQIADPRWLATLLAAARTRAAACVGGAIALSLPTGAGSLTALSRRLLGEQPFAGGIRPCDGRDIPSTGSLLIAKRLFQDAGGFDAAMTAGGEDAEWVRRVLRRGARVIIAPAALVHHVIPAHRAGAAYTRWVAERTGTQLAYTDWKHYGTGLMLALCAARLCQAAALFVPQLAVAQLPGAAAWRVDPALRLRRVRGYVRQAFVLAWRRPRRRPFSRDLHMRAEYARFGLPGPERR